MFEGDPGDRVICASHQGMLTLALQHYEAERALTPTDRLIYVSISLLLVLVGGICAGLTLGLLSFSPIDLELIKRTATSPKQKRMALQVEKVTRNPHQLLVCLLVVNAACMETIPLLLDRLLNPVAAILISVTAILIFSEVVPQAVCKKYGLEVGASFAWLVHIMLFITWPVSYPIGKTLDWLLGSHNKAFFRRAELKEFVTLHGEAPEEEGASESVLTTEECQVIHGALDMAHKTAESAMTPLEKVYSISADAPFDKTLLRQIIEAGHSRVPVYDFEDAGNIIGLILVKELLMHEPNGTLKIRDCTIREIDFIRSDTPLYSVMQLFQMKRRHMAVVIKPGGEVLGRSGRRLGRIGEEVEEQENFENFGEASTDFGSARSVDSLGVSIGIEGGGIGSITEDVVGIITAEDVLEVRRERRIYRELLQTEWQDETDRYLDNRFEVRVAPTPRDSDLPPGLLRYVGRAQRHQQQRQQALPQSQQQPQQQRVRGQTMMGFPGYKGVSRHSTYIRSSASAPALVDKGNSSGAVGGSGGGGGSGGSRQQQKHLAGAGTSRVDDNAPLLDV